jgi:hypothetical protein
MIEWAIFINGHKVATVRANSADSAISFARAKLYKASYHGDNAVIEAREVTS